MQSVRARFRPGDRRGLIADLKIANRARGDETLELCSEGMLSASAGFGVNPRTGQILDRARRIRRITHALFGSYCVGPGTGI